MEAKAPANSENGDGSTTEDDKPRIRYRPRKQRIKDTLKRIVQDYNREIAFAGYLLGDYLQNGAIDGSLLSTALGGLF